MFKGYFQRAELLHFNYSVVPHAIETIRILKEKHGLKIAACSNSNTPLKRIKVLEAQGDFKVGDIFDEFIVSGNVGVRKPNPEILKLLLNKFPGVKPHEAFLVGDQLDRDVACAH